MESNGKREFTHEIETIRRPVVDAHADVMLFEEQSKGILISMVAAALVSNSNCIVKGHFALFGYSCENTQRALIHTGSKGPSSSARRQTTAFGAEVEYLPEQLLSESDSAS